MKLNSNISNFKGKTLTIKQIKGMSGVEKSKIVTVRALKLRKIGDVSNLVADDCILGMIRKVHNFLDIVAVK